MEPEKLAILHDHYRDTCGVMQDQRASRDRYFYYVLAVLAVALFDLAAPANFGRSLGEVLKAKLELSVAPDLGYVRALLWFLLLGFTTRYCQTALAVERQYDYVHRIEAALGRQIDGAFTRESEAYLANYPLFLDWAHYLYTLVFPMLLCLVTIVWTYRQIPAWPWPGAVWFEICVSLAIVASIAMYFVAFHRGQHQRPSSTRARRGR